MENTLCSSADAPTATRPVIFLGSRTCPGSWEVPTWAWRFPAWACSLLRISRPTRSRDLAIGPRTRSRPLFKRELGLTAASSRQSCHGGAYAGLTKSDVRAIVEYLSSLPAISHKVPGPFGLGEKPAICRMTILPPEKASQHD